jgi:hypothetical protein
MTVVATAATPPLNDRTTPGLDLRVVQPRCCGCRGSSCRGCSGGSGGGCSSL